MKWIQICPCQIIDRGILWRVIPGRSHRKIMALGFSLAVIGIVAAATGIITSSLFSGNQQRKWQG